MLKIRRPLGRLIFNMGIAIPGKTVFLIETAPWSLVRGIYRSLTGPHNWGPVMQSFDIFFLVSLDNLCWTNSWVVGDLRHHDSCDVTVTFFFISIHDMLTIFIDLFWLNSCVVYDLIQCHFDMVTSMGQFFGASIHIKVIFLRWLCQKILSSHQGLETNILNELFMICWCMFQQVLSSAALTSK